MTATWRITEVVLEGMLDHDNPYLDLEPVVVFTGPDGRRIPRPAFWDGGRVWRVRFAAPVPGEWSYAIETATGDPGLDSAAGVVRIEPDAHVDELTVYRHGFLRAAASGRHLEHADGTPFFWLADTHWRFAWERWDEANKPGWTSQFRGMVDHRVEQGFTVYQSNIFSYGDGGVSSDAWGEGEPYRVLDPEYFRDVLDPRFGYIAEAGLVHAVGLAWYNAIDADPGRVARFARYIVARYGSYPVVWTLAGEVAGYDPELRESRIDGWREVAHAIRDADGYPQPRTAHLTNERPIADYYQGEDWLDFTLNQLGHGDLDLSPSHYRDHFAAHPGVPMIEGESMYEGITSVEPVGRRPATDTMVRQIAYRAIQSGCCGYSYGGQGCWNNGWDHEQGATMWGSLPWYDGIDLLGATQLGLLRGFYESLPWWRLTPVFDVFDAGGMMNAVFYPPVVSADEERRTVVAYFGETYRSEEGAPAFVGLLDILYRMWWFDPRTGATLPAGERLEPREGRLDLPAKPTPDDDWVLVAQAEPEPTTA
ncbi:MAG TPA: DUF4038 domain-containing protein [Pseudolysinimonas sp.]|nr:DUF4038 domain-containing protein [Pseudolysinimonas sp.]